jgi:serine/threonine protein kinase
MAYKPGQRVDQWTLIEEIGEGGNGSVWRAQSDKGELVALKICKSRTGYGLNRFVQEVEFQRRIGVERGLLPLLDARLPERPTSGAPAWLATPIAITIRDALGKLPTLHSAISAVAAIGGALSKLHSEHDASHRDVKPDNLFKLNDEWVVGDFGLIDFPEKPELTASNRSLGPRFFMADEMINAPDEADGKLADIYSLAKTLYVLAIGSTYPPQGTHRIDDPGMCISSFVPAAPKALDYLMQRATARNPDERLSMEDFVQSLTNLLALPTTIEPSTVDLKTFTENVRMANERSLSVKAKSEVMRQALAQEFRRLELAAGELTAIIQTIPKEILFRSSVTNQGGMPGHTAPVSWMLNQTTYCFSKSFIFKLAESPEPSKLEHVMILQPMSSDKVQFDSGWIKTNSNGVSELIDRGRAVSWIGSADYYSKTDAILKSQLENIVERLDRFIGSISEV